MGDGDTTASPVRRPSQANVATPSPARNSKPAVGNERGKLTIFLSKPLDTMSKHNPKKFPKVSEACKASLALLEKNKAFLISIDKAPPASTAQLDDIVNEIVNALVLACESRDSLLMREALECFEKLINHKFVLADTPLKGQPQKLLIDRVVNVTADTFKKAKGEKDYPDETVQVQIIRALLAAVASERELRDEILHKAFKTVYDICVATKNLKIVIPAKASLDQMLNATFQRLTKLPKQEPIANGHAENGESATEKKKEKEKEKVETEPIVDGVVESEVDNNAKGGSENEGEDSEKEAGEKAKEDDEERDQEPSEGNGDADSKHEEPTAEAQEEKSEPQKQDKGKDKEPQVAVPTTNGTSSTTSTPSTARAKPSKPTEFYTLFRILCDSSNEEVSETISLESNEMRSKILSLELIETVLKKPETLPVLREREEFVQNVIRKHLCPSIGTNATSPVPRVFQLALSIFLVLVSHYKNYLKEEIGIYFAKIFLKVLESDNSATSHKSMVLQGLQEICNNPQTLLDIFVNYDCSLEASDSDIFERMVNDLSSIANKNSTTEHGASTAFNADNQLKVMGLECLVTIMKSLVDWSKELHEGVEKQHTVEDPVSAPNSDVAAILEEDKERESSPVIGSEMVVKNTLIKQHIKTAKQKFNVNPSMGVKYLVDHELVENHPAVIAKWIRENAEGLDKRQIGQYFVKGGKRNEFTKEMLYSYISLIDFTGLPVDLAIRKMLYGFLLLGEEQQVDMVVEALAARYIHDNPESVFATADAAYIFAYSVIMLATDLHSPHIAQQNKMTLEQWMRNHKGINDGKDLPDDFQAEAYARIARTPLKLDEEEEYAPVAVAGLQQRELRWVSEGKVMTKKVQQLLKQRFEDNKGSTFHSANRIEIVKPMFEVCWCPMLAAFSILLKTSNDTEIIDLCLTGFKCAIRVSAIFCMETTRDAFVTSLVTFTNLTNLREIKHKNVASIKTLITIAHTEGNHLQASWGEVLQCISKLHQMQLLGASVSTFEGTPATGTNQGPPSRPATPVRPTAAPAEASGMGRTLADLFGSQRGVDTTTKPTPNSFEGINAETVAKEIEGVAIDRIFTDTVRLSSNAIVDFVECLCAVSLEEINEQQNRTFSLQKLVEVADYNMGRIRIVWSSIWGILGKHFVSVGCHKNLDTAIYAIDSLKQLATKFLAKDELANYHFQKDFLKPFEAIIQNQPSVPVRDMIISCCNNMIQARAENIKSGWKSIFGVLTAAAGDTNEQIVRPAFNIVVDIRTKLFELIADSFFVEFVNCLVAFGKNQAYKDISLGAINSLVFCAGQLANGNVVHLKEGESGQTDSAFSAEDQHIKYWFPILTGFAEVVSHPHIDVRTIALERLFDVFKDYGSMLDGPLWNLVFRGVILPIFVGVRIGINDRPKDESDVWIATTCMHATQSLVGLVSHFFDKISFLLDEVLALLTSFILQDAENLAEIGCTCLLLLVMKDGGRFTPHMWDIVCMTIEHVIKHTMPTEVFRYTPPRNATRRTRRTASQSKANGNEDSEFAAAGVGDLGLPPSRDTSAPHSDEELDNNLDEGSNNNEDWARRLGRVPEERDEEDEEGTRRSPLEQMSLKLARVSPPPATFTSVSNVKARAAVHLILLGAVGDMYNEHGSVMSIDNIQSLLNTVMESWRFAVAANNDASLRTNLSPTGVMSKIIKIEIGSMSCCLRVLFKLYTEDQADKQALGQSLLLPTIKSVMEEFVSTALNFSSGYTHAKAQLIVQAVEAINALNDEKFSENLRPIYHHLIALMASDNKEVRATLQAVFARIGALHNLAEVTWRPVVVDQQAQPPQQQQPKTPIKQ